ncbi:Uncharacterized protein FWK35_00011662 [Aphis craccivora]|uniref:Endonuclease/exonuclease/phosphatase domain-containing protein n=1 Tax=Aphis craccivora TaxID=307492 RepID=A0A6G0Y147_APHCR|nr:Uncharacterized protein FWK35_00011662 [Aphis craccivora]
MEQLLDTKLAKLENRIVKGLVNPSGITPDIATKQATNIVIEEHNSTVSACLSSPVKSFHDECTNLQIKQKQKINDLELFCTEWWCPMHSNFAIKLSTYEDETLIKRAHWAKGDTVRCCTNDRKRSTQPKPYMAAEKSADFLIVSEYNKADPSWHVDSSNKAAIVNVNHVAITSSGRVQVDSGSWDEDLLILLVSQHLPRHYHDFPFRLERSIRLATGDILLAGDFNAKHFD